MKIKYKNLDELPKDLMNETIEVFCNKLWEMMPEPKSREMGNNLGMLAQDLYNVIIDELYCLNIVKSIEEKETLTH